jgi:alkylhydroperoxidase family enzyme
MAASDKQVDSFELDARLKALKAGETTQRLFAVSAWWETPFFTEEERIVLKLAEQVTRIAISMHMVAE